MEKRKFTKDEKLAIIKEVSEQGLKSTLEKYNLYPASYYSWKKKFDEMGEEGFTHGITRAQIRRIRELEKENKLLKELIIDKELEGKLKDDLLKKKFALEKKKRNDQQVCFSRHEKGRCIGHLWGHQTSILLSIQ